MRKVVLIITLGLVAGSAFGQFQANTLGSGGVLWDKAGIGHFALFAGAESDFGLVVNDSQGYDLVFRAGYFHVRGDNQIKAINGFLVAKKSIGIWNTADWFVALGGGGTIQLRDEADISKSGLKFETGITVWKKLSVFAGCDYYPIEAGKDPVFAYLGFDFAPRVVKK